MDIAIVTGANTRIGLAIARKLIETGCRVYGLGKQFDGIPYEHSDFVPVSCDLTNTEHLCQVVQEIIDREKNIYVLVNHARYMAIGRQDTLELNDLESLVHTNLLAPLILTRLTLPSLSRLSGYILNIGFPDLPGSHRLGSAFLSTELALQHFSDRLYEEVRQQNVKVCSLILDTANAESLFQSGFTERENHDLIVCSEATAQAVDYVISQKRNSVVSRLVIRPQKGGPAATDKPEGGIATSRPYRIRDDSQKVVIGRLKKEVAPQPEVQGPATYMDMAREIAEEEAQRAEQKARPDEGPPQHRRRKKRSRKPRRPHHRRDSSAKPDSGETGSQTERQKERPDPQPHQEKASKQAPQTAGGDSSSGKKRARRSKSEQPARDSQSISKKSARKKAHPKPPPVKKAARKRASTKAPAKKSVAKKAARKRAAKKAPKKTARKRPIAKKQAD